MTKINFNHSNLIIPLELLLADGLFRWPELNEGSLAEVHGLVGTAARRSLCCCLLLAVIDHGGVSASATTFATASLTGCSSHPGGDCDTPINQSSSN